MKIPRSAAEVLKDEKPGTWVLLSPEREGHRQQVIAKGTRDIVYSHLDTLATGDYLLYGEGAVRDVRKVRGKTASVVADCLKLYSFRRQDTMWRGSEAEFLIEIEEKLIPEGIYQLSGPCGTMTVMMREGILFPRHWDIVRELLFVG